MLGEQIDESKGKRIVRKILSTEPLKLEVTVEAAGKLLGQDVTEIITYSSQFRPDGSLYGEGEGVYLSSGGDVITWKGAGVGTLAANGVAAYRGAVYFYTASPKFARLNTVPSVFEFQSDAQGNTQSKTWEWK